MNTKLDSTSKVFLTLYGAVEVLFLNLVFIFFAILASYTNYIPKTEALIFFLCGKFSKPPTLRTKIKEHPPPTNSTLEKQ